MRGQFFSLDVFIAAIVLVTGAVVLLYSIVGATSLQQAQLFSADILRETLTSSVRELNYQVLTNPDTGYADPANEYDIRNFDMTLGELIGEYHYLGTSASGVDVVQYLGRRDNITRRTIAPLISSQYSYTISIIDATDGSSDLLSERRRIERDSAQFVVVSRNIVAGIDRNREFFGPYTLEVVVWN